MHGSGDGGRKEKKKHDGGKGEGGRKGERVEGAWEWRIKGGKKERERERVHVSGDGDMNDKKEHEGGKGERDGGRGGSRERELRVHGNEG